MTCVAQFKNYVQSYCFIPYFLLVSVMDFGGTSEKYCSYKVIFLFRELVLFFKTDKIMLKYEHRNFI